MPQAITNYTTYDLAYYYADVKRLPRLSDEERQQLLATLAQQTTTHLHEQARTRLIEGYLSLVTHIALDRCPPSYYRSLPDIIGEATLTLVKTVDRYNFHREGGNLTAYVAACTDAAVKQTIGADRLINVSSWAIWKAKQQGTVEQLYHLQPESLDKWMEWYETDEREEPATTPILPTQEAPPRDPELRAQVQAWLSYLSPRNQKILTLRYGLSDEDERCWTVAEIAREMGLKETTIRFAIRDALKRIRALIAGTATMSEKNGQQQITGVYQFTPPKITVEHEALFRQAIACLHAQGINLSASRLAREAGKNIQLARAFLRLHPDEFPMHHTSQMDTQERLTHLARVCDELEARGERPTVNGVARIAHVKKETVSAFLKARRSEQYATA